MLYGTNESLPSREPWCCFAVVFAEEFLSGKIPCGDVLSSLLICVDKPLEDVIYNIKGYSKRNGGIDCRAVFDCFLELVGKLRRGATFGFLFVNTCIAYRKNVFRSRTS